MNVNCAPKMKLEGTCESQLLATLASTADAVVIRRAFLLLTRLHWSTPFNYGRYAEAFADTFYSDDEKARKLEVDLTDNADPSAAQFRLPSIFVGLGQYSFERVVVGNYGGHSDDRATTYKTTRGQNMVQWFHFAEHSDAALAMAEVTNGFAASIGDLLKNYLNIENYMVAGMTPPMKIAAKDSVEKYQCSLTATFTFNNVLSLTHESHRLKKIIHDLRFIATTPDVKSV